MDDGEGGAASTAAAADAASPTAARCARTTREVKEPRTKGLEQRARAVPKAFEMPAPPEMLS